MKILILDDIKYRHDIFDQIYALDDITHAYTYSQFLEYLELGSPWDLILLDHDLGDFVSRPDKYVDELGVHEYNGQHAAYNVTLLEDDRLPREVIIHSVNPYGAQAMFTILKERGLLVSCHPFPYPPKYDNEGNSIVV